jgi:alpha-galactosidase
MATSFLFGAGYKREVVAAGRTRCGLAASLGLALLSLEGVFAGTVPAQPVFQQWALKPPMGWNSWDCFATTVTEAQAREQVDSMTAQLAPYGWQYLTIDIQWYEPEAKSFEYRKNATLSMDEFGRLWPATNRFPSSANSAGFKALSDYAHGKGLKFGVHLLRGIPRQAVARNTAIKDTRYHAADVADINSTCKWNGDMYGVDMAKPGAQDYYNSVFELFAEWGVDFVKVDDIARPYHKAEIEAIRQAIDRTRRPMVLSLSPGETPLGEGAHVETHANMWRVSDDFWDKWSLLAEQFERLRKWTEFRGPGHFPDADMLPLGVTGMGRYTKFTRDEQLTLMTLWSIARSPLIFGGDMTRLDDFTLSLLTNREVIAVDQDSAGNRQLFNHDGLIAWVADAPGSTDKYVALFNTQNARSEESGTEVAVRFADLGLGETCRVRDLWGQKDLGEFKADFAPGIRWHGAGLYRVAAGGSAPALANGSAAAPASLPFPLACYLFSYFTGNGQDGLHLAWSKDGYRWEALKGGESFLKPQVGKSKLMRDPCLLRGPDGTFHLVWTDSWDSKTIGYATSKDLVHWSEQQALPVMADEPATLNCWAPEIVWNAPKEEFLIFWSSTVTNRFMETAGTSEDGYNHRIYSTSTRDFKTFSPTRLFYDAGFSEIDATELAANGQFYVIFKDETVKPPKKHLRIASGNAPDGPFGPPGPPFTRDWVEGPTAVLLGDEYIVYFDCYRDHHYGAMKSKDLVHWEDVTSRLAMPKGMRHGTALEVPGGVVEALAR